VIDLKPYGAFIEHTLRPFVEEIRWFLTECDRQRLHITEDNVTKVLRKLAYLHIITTVVEALKQVILMGLVCLTAYIILR